MLTLRLALSRGVRVLREAKGLTRKQLAEAAGVGHVSIWSLEKNGTLPHERTLAKLASALDAVDEVALAVAGREAPL